MRTIYIILLLFLNLFTNKLSGQNLPTQFLFEGLEEAAFTPFHVYFTKSDGGIVVYRLRETGLVYLFENEDVASRGKLIHSDMRFAYLLSEDEVLSILDPNSLLLVTKRIQLDFKPLTVHREGNELILISTDIVEIHSLADNDAKQEPIRIELAFSLRSGAFTESQDESYSIAQLSEEGQLYQLIWQADSSKFEYQIHSLAMQQPDLQILAKDDAYYYLTSTDRRSLFRLDSTKSQLIHRFESPITSIHFDPNSTLDAYLITDAQNLWQISLTDPIPPKLLINSGGIIELFYQKSSFWLRRGERVQQVDLQTFEDVLNVQITADRDMSVAIEVPQFEAIPRIIHPASEILLVPIKLASGWKREGLYFEVSPKEKLSVKDRTIEWKTSLQDVGSHEFELSVHSPSGLHDQQKLLVEVRPFNAPPEFLPQRALTVVSGEEVQISVRALDPDGWDRTLLSYRGRGFVDGMKLEAKEGVIRWKPGLEHVGTHEFEIIATDQYGASSNKVMQIKVVANPNLGKGENEQ